MRVVGMGGLGASFGGICRVFQHLHGTANDGFGDKIRTTVRQPPGPVPNFHHGPINEEKLRAANPAANRRPTTLVILVNGA